MDEISVWKGAETLIAVVGGTGLDIKQLLSETTDSPTDPRTWTEKRAYKGRVNGIDTLFLQRHQGGIPPHLIQYKENFRLLMEQRVDYILLLTACGSLKPRFHPGQFALPTDFLDATGRQVTFIETTRHPTTEHPFDKEGAQILGAEFGAVEVGPIVSIPGPRFATRAESIVHVRAGADLINMTTATESGLCLELDIPHNVLAFITDYDHGVEGRGEQQVSYDVIKERFKEAQESLQARLPVVLPLLDDMITKRKG